MDDAIRVIWVTQGNASMMDSMVLAQDPLYGVDSDITGVIECVDNFGKTQIFIVDADASENSEVQSKLELFVENYFNKGLRQDIMGDFWPQQIGEGEGYDVYMCDWNNISVIWMDNSDPS